MKLCFVPLLALTDLCRQFFFIIFSNFNSFIINSFNFIRYQLHAYWVFFLYLNSLGFKIIIKNFFFGKKPKCTFLTEGDRTKLTSLEHALSSWQQLSFLPGFNFEMIFQGLCFFFFSKISSRIFNFGFFWLYIREVLKFWKKLKFLEEGFGE